MDMLTTDIQSVKNLSTQITENIIIIGELESMLCCLSNGEFEGEVSLRVGSHEYQLTRAEFSELKAVLDAAIEHLNKDNDEKKAHMFNIVDKYLTSDENLM